MKTSKRQKNHGKMVKVSQYKLRISQLGSSTLPSYKVKKIKEQVEKCQEALKTLKTYQPFTSASPKRKPRQVGA